MDHSCNRVVLEALGRSSSNKESTHRPPGLARLPNSPTTRALSAMTGQDFCRHGPSQPRRQTNLLHHHPHFPPTHLRREGQRRNLHSTLDYGGCLCVVWSLSLCVRLCALATPLLHPSRVRPIHRIARRPPREPPSAPRRLSPFLRIRLVLVTSLLRSSSIGSRPEE